MNRKGFSLVEIMIVVAIIGILVAALLPQLGEMINGARKSSAERSMNAIKDAIVRFNASEPRELEDLNWLVPRYLAEIKPDPWGTPYSFLADDGVIISYGPDRRAHSDLMHPDNRDNIEVYYKPPLQILSAKMTLDKNGNRRFNNGDRFTIFLTKPARTTALPASGDFEFVDRYEIDTANEILLGNFSTYSPPAGTPPYVRDLGGSGGGEITLTYVDPRAVKPPYDKSHDDGYPETGGLRGNPRYDSAITFEVKIADDRYEIVRDIYVRFDDDSVDPSTATYRDQRGNPAVQNGYNVQIETY